MVSLLPHELHKLYIYFVVVVNIIYFMICSGEHKLFTSPHTKERLIQRINLLFCVFEHLLHFAEETQLNMCMDL